MTIAFIHNGKAFLPEIEAYISFFSAFSEIRTEVCKQPDIHKIQADVEWYFMGTHLKRSKNNIVIHEYSSASMPPFGSFKNVIKRHINCLPDYRIFYSKYVCEQFGFAPKVPFGLRGHGILKTEPDLKATTGKRYHFIYIGTIDEKRRLDSLFNCFAGGSLKGKSLLILSKDYAKTASRFSSYPNIQFKGPVPYHEVYLYIMQSVYAINFMPDIVPFNKQVSAKFLDYVACGIPVITSNYEWVIEFEKQFGGGYFYLKPDLSNFTWENITGFNYSFPNLQQWTWEKQIKNSGIVTFLQKKFPAIPLITNAEEENA